MFENKSILEIKSLIKSKEVTVKEVVKFYLERIKKYNPALNAIVLQKEEEQIFHEINLKDNEDNKSKPLFGLPLACKDLFDIKGIPSTYGFPPYKNNIAKKNSLIVDRLINSGAIIIGKTNTAELGVGGHTTNRLFGPTSNPYDFTKTSAGSSGGAGAAVAAGLIPTDRANEKNISKLTVLTSPGCFAKSPEEMSFLLDCIIGSDPLDPLSFDIDGSFKESKITDKQISNIKIGWLNDMNNSYQFENGIISMCESKLKELEKHNILIESLQPKINSSKMWDSWTTLRAKSIFEDTESMNLKNIEEMTYQAIWEYKKGANIKDDDIEKAINQKNECTKEVDEVFKGYDFLILPSAQVFPFDKNVQFPKRINNFELDTYHRWIEVFIMSSLLDLPTITVPVGFNENGMPMGMQIIAKKFDDLKLLAFAKRYEEIFNYSKIKPKFSN